MKFLSLIIIPLLLISKVAISIEDESGNSHLPHYIKPQNFNYRAENPEIYEESDAILGIYYNVLYPIDHQIDKQNAIISWLRNNDNSFPFNEKYFEHESQNYFAKSSIRVFESIFAEYVFNKLKAGEPLDQALALSIQEMRQNIIPHYTNKAEVIQRRMLEETHPFLKIRLQYLLDSLLSCIQDPDKQLAYSKKMLRDYKDQPHFFSHIEGIIQKGREMILPKSDYWNNRIIALKETIKKVTDFAPNSPYFLALQEVTPSALMDLKGQFPELTWISYNLVTAKETRNSGEQEVVGEFFSQTATIALSSDLEVVRIDHAPLPSVSGYPRRILGVEVYDRKTQRNFAIFTMHTDHIVKDNLYERNIEAISEFILRFAVDLPFIFGGDLNAFENFKGDAYIQNLQKIFAGSAGYRDGPFFSPHSIAYSTFIGHVLDPYKEALIEKDGNISVHPNALDHIFLGKLKIVWGIREAGVYDEEGHIVDPYSNGETYNLRLKERKTASDHFLNGVLFKF